VGKDVRACNPGDPVAEAAAILCEVRVRRIPVVDDWDQVIGLISLGDLARESARQASFPNPEITEAAVGTLLAAISEPRERRREALPAQYQSV
jgi:predicted transcriptional regulator